jgi:hypothetical protein
VFFLGRLPCDGGSVACGGPASSGLIRDRYCRPSLKQLNLISACYADGGEPRVDEGAPAEGGTGRILSDIGGSYPENESRLSDIALGWMAGEAKRAGLTPTNQLLVPVWAGILKCPERQ